jgi:hypothetical protein
MSEKSLAGVSTDRRLIAGALRTCTERFQSMKNVFSCQLRPSSDCVEMNIFFHLKYETIKNHSIQLNDFFPNNFTPPSLLVAQHGRSSDIILADYNKISNDAYCMAFKK